MKKFITAISLISGIIIPASAQENRKPIAYVSNTASFMNGSESGVMVVDNCFVKQTQKQYDGCVIVTVVSPLKQTDIVHDVRLSPAYFSNHKSVAVVYVLTSKAPMYTPTDYPQFIVHFMQSGDVRNYSQIIPNAPINVVSETYDGGNTWHYR